jgi:hypothetical protein
LEQIAPYGGNGKSLAVMIKFPEWLGKYYRW